MIYLPNPKDTRDIELGPDIMNLAEQLAKNVHENWAKERINQGWTYGKERKDNKKKHSCLVPYEELPAKEKVYDYNSAIETLKFIKSLGYEIVKRDDDE
ncbi:RyR domain-containing protein [Haloplasma contractile]